MPSGIFNKSTSLLYCLLLAAHMALVWWLPYFPTQDGPSHLYNLVILKDLVNGGKVWGDYYINRLDTIPNFGFHIIAYPLLSLFSPGVIEKIFISLYILLMTISVPFFMRSFDKPVFPFSFLVFPVVFNFNLMMGFYSYSVAVPFFLIAFSCCFRFRDKPLLIRFVIYNLTGIVIYYMHLIVFGIFVLALLVLALSESGGLKDKLRNLVNLLIIISPLLINLLLYLINSNDFKGVPFRFIPWSDRIIDLVTLSCATLSNWQKYLGVILFDVFICCFTFGVCNIVKESHQDIRWLFIADRGARCLLYITVALILICLLSPFNIGAGSFFNQRFPWIILLVALPVLHTPDRYVFARFTSSVLIVISTVFLVCNAAVMHQKSSTIEEFLGGLSVDFPKGAYVMTYKTEDDYFRVDTLLHAASYYGINKRVFVFGNYEATQEHFPVSFKHNLARLPGTQQIYYDGKSIDWQIFTAIQYLLVWKADQMSIEKISQFYRNIYKSGNISVWQRFN